jgi:hypothetical protein
MKNKKKVWFMLAATSGLIVIGLTLLFKPGAYFIIGAEALCYAIACAVILLRDDAK